MKKPFKNTELSDVKFCRNHRKGYEKNPLTKNSKAQLCYRYFYPVEMARRSVIV